MKKTSAIHPRKSLNLRALHQVRGGGDAPGTGKTLSAALLASELRP